MFPFAGMPQWAQWVGQALPLTHYLRIVRAIMLKGATLADLRFDTLFLGGLMLTNSANRASAALGGWLAALSGAWLVVGTVISPLWNAGFIGIPSGTPTDGVWERIGMFDGLGVVIVFLAAIALGRTSVNGVRDVQARQARADAARQIDLTSVQPAHSETSPTRSAEVSSS